jgi:Uma2 family endonuclease
MSAEPVEPVEPMPAQALALARLMQVARRRPLGVADVRDLDASIGRVELIDGNLIVTPLADVEHQDLCFRLTQELNRALPAGLRAFMSINVFDPGSESTYVNPDVVVADPARLVRNGLGVDLDTVALVVEVTSSNRATDFGIKRDLFARFDVPYLIVDRKTRPHSHHVFGAAPAWLADALEAYRR